VSITTELHFYRPTDPPIVTGGSLAEFVRAFQNLGLCEEKGSRAVRLKFGEAIDQDEKPSAVYEPVNSVVYSVSEIEWDAAEQCESVSSVQTLLAAIRKPIYRAHLELGAATDDVIEQLKRVNSPDNDTDLWLTGWGLHIEPILSASFTTETYFIGWISVSISGYGYLFPWTFSDLVQRAEAHPGIRQLKELCRRTWPVEARSPTPQQQEVRKQMGELWPYDRIDLRWDWYWGLQEG
jgi:hypothetical protein